MNDILKQYEPITLDEMGGIRLMNRTDTKFVTNKTMLRQLLIQAAPDYRVQDINGERIAPYYTVYFDTPDVQMYRRHLTGHASRQKLRIRSYVHSGLNFLEVKTKNNHGRTRKDRVKLEGFDPNKPEHDINFCSADQPWNAYEGFIHDHLSYDPRFLSEQLENHFNRITLVNKRKTERLTIDFDLCFDNLATGEHLQLGDIVIIELKRDGLQPSPILRHLQALRIKPMGFSKYVIGSILTNRQLPCNRLKIRVHQIEKLAH